MIDRDQFGKACEQFFEEFLKNGADEESMAKLIFVALAFGKLERILFEEENDNWISVDNRLPEPKTWVLTHIKYSKPVFEMERSMSKTDSIKKVFYDGKSFYYDSGTITHWQPLPEPPKEENYDLSLRPNEE